MMAPHLTVTALYLFLLCFIVFICTRSFLVPLARKIAFARGWIDDPGKSDRKLHKEPVAYLGGLAIYGGLLAGLGAFYIFFPVLRQSVEVPTWTLAYLVGAGLVLAIGTLDDILDIPAKRKLLAQVVVVLLVYLSGVKVDHIALPWVGMVELGQLSAPVTILTIVVVMNAINLVDGLDGLACGVALVATMANAILAFHLNSFSTVLLALIAISAMLGFITHNFYPARIFLGDGGSLLLGYLLAIIGIQNIQASGSFVEAVVPVLAVLYPIADIGMAMVRRYLRGKPMMSADRGHIHHRLLELGFNQRQIFWMMAGLTALAVATGMLFVYGQEAVAWSAAALLGGIVVVGLLALQYLNFSGVGFTMQLRPVFKKFNAYRQLINVHMRYAETEEELRRLMSDAAREYQLTSLFWKDDHNQQELRLLLADAGDVGSDVKVHRVRMCGGEMHYTMSADMHPDLQVEVDTLIRSLVKTLDKTLARLRK